MLRERWMVPLLLSFLVIGGCAEALNEDDLKCESNADCVPGYGCDADGDCVEFEQGKALVITTDGLQYAEVGVTYGDTVYAEGGIRPYSWTATFTAGGGAVAWLTMTPDTGRIDSSEPVPAGAPGEVTVAVTVRDSSEAGTGQAVSKDLTIQVRECSGDKAYSYQPYQDACYLGFYDCVDNVIVGEWQAESASTRVSDCGLDCSACDPVAANECVAGLCGCAGSDVCNPDRACCDDGCYDLEQERSHCGACHVDCEVEVAGADGIACENGACTYGNCQPGRYDCNGDATDGCEVVAGDSDCADCNDDCTNSARYLNAATSTCANDINQEEYYCKVTCVDNWGDCVPDDLESVSTLGCETPTDTPENCGGCASVESERDCTVADRNKVCMDDPVAGLRCGCANASTDCKVADDELCCEGLCVLRDAVHCTACFEGCDLVEGPECLDPGDVWGCYCDGDTDKCKGDYPFSFAFCSGNKCTCGGGGAPNCQGTPDDMCCDSSTGLACVDLDADVENCGMCGMVCETVGSGACSTDQACNEGSCGCNEDCPCPADSGAPDCLEPKCVCFAYHGEPCPTGMYCCPGQGCCLRDCDDSDRQCCNPPRFWCPDGSCCEDCEQSTNCL